MGNTPPIKARAACKHFIEITNTQTNEVYLLNTSKIVQVTKTVDMVRITVVNGNQETGGLTYGIHKDCYNQLLDAIAEAQGPPSQPFGEH